jgi:alkaline phosphatase
VGFTTTGHTGEDVFLAVYDPTGKEPRGVIRSDDVNKYICRSMGWINKKGETTLKDSTEKYFCSHDKIFSNCNINLIKNDSLYKWNNQSMGFKVVGKRNKYDILYLGSGKEEGKIDDVILIVEKGDNRLEIPAYKSIYYFNSEKRSMNTISIYVDKNDKFYLPVYMSKFLK